MSIRHFLKKSETIIGVIRDFRRLYKPVRMFFVRNPAIKSYIKSHQVKKLQIGTGPNYLEDWLNTDVSISKNLVYLDATERFPIDDKTFDYIYSEHVIEHISWHQGLYMLKECFRILKPGGIVRLATPDLNVILGLYVDNPDSAQMNYIKKLTDDVIDGIDIYKPSFVINNAFRNWDHQFLYDFDLLELALQSAGFSDIRRCKPWESDDVNLRTVEGKNKPDIYSFETIVVEATRSQ